MRPLYTIAIPVFNHLHLTKKCLESLKISKGIGRAEIIVVNDASTDENATADYLNTAGVGVITLEQNSGLGRCLDKALEFAHAPYFVTLNNDVEILCPDWLEMMREQFVNDPKMALVGIQAADVCGSIDANGRGYQGASFEYVEGAVMMGRTSLLRRIEGGLFDPEYRFAYFEDNDLSLRVRKMGYHIGKVPAAVRHKRCGTMGTVIQQGVDVDGFHRINEETYKKRWGRYIKCRNFTESWGIQRSGANGDVLFLTPILREIKKQNAEAIVSVYTNCREVLADNPDCYAPLTPIGPPDAYDHWINLDGAYESRTGMHIIEAYQEVSGVSTDDWRLHLYPGEEARKWVKETVWKEPYAVIHPHIGQPWMGRNPNTKFMWRVATWLKERGWKVVLLGTAYTPGIPCDLNLQGKTTLRQAASLVEGAGLFFGVDSALMNFAQASLIPTVGIFGAMNYKNILLPFPFVKALTAKPMECGCLGCHTVYAERPKGSPGRCIRERGDVCMDRLREEDAVKAIEQVLGAKELYKETSKIRARVLPFCQGKGIDIGCGRDPLTDDCVAYDDDPWPEVTMRGDARRIPISDGTFDWVYSSHCIEDLDDTEAVLKEWVRILKKGGKLIVVTPCPDLFTGFNKEHVWPGFTPDELSQFVRNAGCMPEISDVWADYSTVVVARKL
jgi:ADP-heptose:LPS heptosyltransferase/glycosyltransferase involved in cell wall biosynthesis